MSSYKLMPLAATSGTPPSRARTVHGHRVRESAGSDRALIPGTLTPAPKDQEIQVLRNKAGDASFVLARPHARGAYGAISYAGGPNEERLIAKTMYTQRSGEQSRNRVNVMPVSHAIHEMSVARHVPEAVDSIAGVSTGDRLVHVMELMDGNWAQAQDASQMQTHLPTLGLEAFAQSAKGLASFHAAGVLHGDVKLENLLWNQAGNIKWGDYGFSTRLHRASRQTEGTRGSPFAMAPEVAEHRRYGFAADMWSFGVALGEMFVGHQASPFRLLRQPQERAYLTQEGLVGMDGRLDESSLVHGFSPMHLFFQQWYKVSPETCRFGVEELFHYDPARRATSDRAVEVAEHLLAARASHAQAAPAALATLCVPDGEREATFERLACAW